MFTYRRWAPAFLIGIMVAALGTATLGTSGASQTTQRPAGRAASAKPASKATKTPTPSGLEVILFNVTGTSAASEDEAKRALTQRDKLRETISTLPLYRACLSQKANTPACNIDDAAIFVHGSYTNGKVVYQSFDVRARRPIATVPLDSLDAVATVEQVRRLLGRITVVDDGLAVSSGVQQYVQLVPFLDSSTDPDYAVLLAHMLARRNITALRSNMTLGGLNSSPDSTICANGEQYLVYYVTLQTESKVLLGHSRVSANANGFIADCNRHITFPFAAEDKRSVPTLKNSLAQYGTILAGSLFPKFSWTPINSTAGTVASFLDVDPTSVNVRNNVAELALQRMVDNLCVAASAIYTPTPTPTPTSSASPSANDWLYKSNNVTTTIKATTTGASRAAGASGAASTGATLDLAAFAGPDPYFVSCNAAAGNALHVEPVKGNGYTGLFDRWKTPPAPTPTP